MISDGSRRDRSPIMLAMKTPSPRSRLFASAKNSRVVNCGGTEKYE